MKIKTYIVLLITLFLAGCSAPPETPDTIGAMYRGGLQHNGVFEVAAPPASGELVWQFETNGEAHASPVYAEGVVYIPSYDKNLYALDAQSGEEIWQAPLPGITFSSPTVLEDSIYLGTFDGFIALDRATGEKKWHFPTERLGLVRSSPVIYKGAAY
ncbi:MAG: PQQ-like beta-propeller repeat protein, partial [Anaerolineae bacterium]|nr:PQQ-like beta-propeller repeat protein [Anaerolineae bacterium]